MATIQGNHSLKIGKNAEKIDFLKKLKMPENPQVYWHLRTGGG